MWLSYGISSVQENKQFSPRKKMVKKWYWCKGWSIQNTYICLQQGNGPTSGGQHNQQQGGKGKHFGAKWWRRKWGAINNTPGRYDDRIKQGTWKIGNTNVSCGWGSGKTSTTTELGCNLLT